jgi:hypothetical protein
MDEEERFSKIEDVMSRLVDKTNHLDDVMTVLPESHIKLISGLDRMSERLDRVAKESEERDRRLGERIETLVIAMGEFISRLNPGTTSAA